MKLTDLPIFNEFKDLQPWNAEDPIEITESGIVIEVKCIKLENA